MHYWSLFIALIAVLEPIACYTDRDLVNGRGECCELPSDTFRKIDERRDIRLNNRERQETTRHVLSNLQRSSGGLRLKDITPFQDTRRTVISPTDKTFSRDIRGQVRESRRNAVARSSRITSERSGDIRKIFTGNDRTTDKRSMFRMSIEDSRRNRNGDRETFRLQSGRFRVYYRNRAEVRASSENRAPDMAQMTRRDERSASRLFETRENLERMSINRLAREEREQIRINSRFSRNDDSRISQTSQGRAFRDRERSARDMGRRSLDNEVRAERRFENRLTRDNVYRPSRHSVERREVRDESNHQQRLVRDSDERRERSRDSNERMVRNEERVHRNRVEHRLNHRSMSRRDYRSDIVEEAQRDLHDHGRLNTRFTERDTEMNSAEATRTQRISKTRDSRERMVVRRSERSAINRLDNDGDRNREISRNTRLDTRNFAKLPLERDAVTVRTHHMKARDIAGPMTKVDSETTPMNWQYLLYTMQGIYMCSILLHVFGYKDSEKKKSRFGNNWFSSRNMVKVE